MPEKHLYEYAVIRLVPRVEREEFLNIGVILYSQSLKFLCIQYHINHDKLHHFADNIEIEEVEEYLKAFDEICHGSFGGGTIGKLDIASRFRWLTATRSTIVQSSKVHSGFCSDPEEEIKKLFNQFVL